MADEVEMDQKVYDELIAQGKSDRIARARAKAATIKAQKVAAGEAVGPRAAAEPAGATAADSATAPVAATAGGGEAAAQAGGGVGTRERTGGGVRTGGLTPEERQARVAAALAERGNGAATRSDGGTRFAGQDHTHRLLAMVPPDGIQQIRGKQEDKVYTWPHLLASEFVAVLAWTAGLVIFSALAPAPLRELANPSLTPNPSKAPWYFLGLQELLRYFHPMIAGVTVPTVGLLLGVALPYFDRNPSNKPENRKFAYVAFTFFLVLSAVLTLVGSFFRGPGFEFVWPWTDGLFFEL
jgi:menaquinol-cytochrome c reductase cytochrome b/c subunit